MSVEKKTKEEITIDPEVQAVADKYAKVATFKDGAFTNTDGVYIEVAKDHDLTEDDIKKVRRLDEIHNAGAGLWMGMASIEEYKKDKNLESTTAAIKLTGRDTLSISSKRHVQNVNPQNREETIHSWGPITSVTKLSAGSKSTSLYGNVYQSVKNAAAAALKDL